MTQSLFDRGGIRLWPWGRTTAWIHVKRVMKDAAIVEGLRKPKALRHGFAVEAGQKGVPLNMIQRWLGHARLETTAIYADALGDEELCLAGRAWNSLDSELVWSEIGRTHEKQTFWRGETADSILELPPSGLSNRRAQRPPD